MASRFWPPTHPVPAKGGLFFPGGDYGLSMLRAMTGRGVSATPYGPVKK